MIGSFGAISAYNPYTPPRFVDGSTFRSVIPKTKPSIGPSDRMPTFAHEAVIGAHNTASQTAYLAPIFVAQQLMKDPLQLAQAITISFAAPAAPRQFNESEKPSEPDKPIFVTAV